MLVVTVELWPGGLPADRVTLATGAIVNDGTGRPRKDVGNYNVTLSRSGQWHPVLLHRGGDAWRRGRVEGHRRREEHIWQLVRKALNAAIEQDLEGSTADGS